MSAEKPMSGAVEAMVRNVVVCEWMPPHVVQFVSGGMVQATIVNIGSPPVQESATAAVPLK